MYGEKILDSAGDGMKHLFSLFLLKRVNFIALSKCGQYYMFIFKDVEWLTLLPLVPLL